MINRSTGHGSTPLVHGVLLSGGMGTRLGSGPKAFATFQNRTFLEHVSATLRETDVERVQLVLPSPPPEPLDIPWVIQDRVSAGPFTSLVRALQTPDLGDGAILIVPIDHIAVLPSTIHALISCFEGTANGGTRWFSPSYEGQPGHPILLGKDVANHARNWENPCEFTLRDFLATMGPPVRVPVDDPGTLLNVNTPDLDSLSQPI